MHPAKNLHLPASRRSSGVAWWRSREVLRRFYLNNQDAIDNHVQPLRAELLLLVEDSNRSLTSTGMTAISQLRSGLSA